MASGGHIFPVETAPMFIAENRVTGGQGASFFTADNPETGATVTYYLGETLRTGEEERQRAERDVAKEGGARPCGGRAGHRAPSPSNLRAVSSPRNMARVDECILANTSRTR